MKEWHAPIPCTPSRSQSFWCGTSDFDSQEVAPRLLLLALVSDYCLLQNTHSSQGSPFSPLNIPQTMKTHQLKTIQLNHLLLFACSTH